MSSALGTKIICCLSDGPTTLKELAEITEAPEFMVEEAVINLVLQGKAQKVGNAYDLGPEYKDLRPAPKPWWVNLLGMFFSAVEKRQCDYCEGKFLEQNLVDGLCCQCSRDRSKYGV